MNLNVVSYSLTGNNRALAESVAKSLNANHISVTETKQRKMSVSVMDLLFNRTPRVQPSPDALAASDAVLLVGPIWIGSIATPLRAYMKRLKKMRCPYAFLSISGGADGTNPKVPDELRRRVKREPAAVADFHIADLLPKEPKPTRDDTSAYKLTETDIANLTLQAVSRLEALTGKRDAK